MAEAGEESSPDSITIRVKDAAGEEMFFKVKKTTKMEKIFSAYVFFALLFCFANQTMYC